jgi:hypothetical protein
LHLSGGYQFQLVADILHPSGMMSLNITGLASAGSVLIDNSKLTSIEGSFAFEGTVRDSVGKVGNITVSNNNGAALELNGWTGLNSAGHILLEKNALESVNGFTFTSGSVQTITIKDGTPTESLTIAAWSGLSSCGAVTIINSKLGLVSAAAFQFTQGRIESVDISNNSPFESLTVAGFTGLASAGSVLIDRSKLGSLSGFQLVAGANVERVTISNNVPFDGLGSLTGFSGLVSAGSISITNNLLQLVSGFVFAAEASSSVGDIVFSKNSVATGFTLPVPMKVSGFTNMVMKQDAQLSVVDNVGLEIVSGFTFAAEMPSSIAAVVVKGNVGLASLSGFTALNAGTTVDVVQVEDNMWDASGTIESTAGSGFASYKTIAVQTNDGLAKISGFNGGSQGADSITITSNSALDSVDGFNGMNSVGEITIASNSALGSVGGFNGMVEGGIAGGITVANNPELASILGFTSLAQSLLVQVRNNRKLANICGLESLPGAMLDFVDNSIDLASDESISIPFEHVGLALRVHSINTFALKCGDIPSCVSVTVGDQTLPPAVETGDGGSGAIVDENGDGSDTTEAVIDPTDAPGDNNSNTANTTNNTGSNDVASARGDDCGSKSSEFTVIVILIVIIMLLCTGIIITLLIQWKKKKDVAKKADVDTFLAMTSHDAVDSQGGTAYFVPNPVARVYNN